MGIGGLEPPTHDLKDRYSIQLSYIPKIKNPMHYT